MAAAQKEFLRKGFHDASLRDIVRDAGVTTGAFYGYFSNKESLFSALVEPSASKVIERFSKSVKDFEDIPQDEQIRRLHEPPIDYLDWLIDYIYGHYDSFKLLICCSGGTFYADFIHRLTEAEIHATERFISRLLARGIDVPPLDRQFLHIITSGMFSAVCEVVIHDMPRQQALRYASLLCTFYHAGWSKVFGLDASQRKEQKA